MGSEAAARLARLHFNYGIFWKFAPVSGRQSRCPLDPVLGAFWNFNLLI
jgi:hypothetical protein